MGYKGGILYGPWTPIYGVGSVVVLYIYNKYIAKLKTHKILKFLCIFLTGFILLSIIEYIGGVLLKILFDETLLNTPASFASISKKDPRYSTDMWRGGVWINFNYFIIKGLKQYGFKKEADEVRNRTLEMIDKWYKKTGVVFEFYDPEDQISPFYCERKGKQPKVPDYRKHVHSIADFNWSCCFAMLLIQGDY